VITAIVVYCPNVVVGWRSGVWRYYAAPRTSNQLQH